MGKGWERGSLNPDLLLGAPKASGHQGERLTAAVAQHQCQGTPELPCPQLGMATKDSPVSGGARLALSLPLTSPSCPRAPLPCCAQTPLRVSR